MNAAQATAFQANAGFSASDMSVVLVSLVFAVLLLWGVGSDCAAKNRNEGVTGFLIHFRRQVSPGC